MKSRSYSSCFIAAAFATLVVLARAEDSNSTNIKFSDPSKPGTIKISLGRGDLQIQGTDTNEVVVKSGAKAATGRPRKDGLREISASSSFSLSEKDNIITLDAAVHDWGRGNGDFRLTVPKNTTILVQNSWGGDFKASNISGDIELNSMHGEIRLEDVAGGVVVGTMNGEIRASIRELQAGKPLSFTSMNGEVQLRLPDKAKANLRLRTQNGSVLTDFDENVIVTKTEAAPMSGRRSFTLKGTRGISIDVQEAIAQATQISATAVRQALEAVKEGLESSKIEADDARRQLEDARKQMEQIERSQRDEERQARDKARTAAREAGRSADAVPPVPPVPAKPGMTPAAPKPAAAPQPPKIGMPTISGGKLVTGTLNGGGPEISVATMNGDVKILKLEQK